MKDYEKRSYQNSLDSVGFSQDFEEKTLNLIGEKKKSYKTGKIIKTAVSVAAIAILMSISAFALPKMLTARQVAEKLHMTQIGEILESEDAKIEQSISCDNLIMTLHSAVHGKELINRNGIDIEEDRDYFVISVISKDGKEFDMAANKIRFTPLVKGYEVHKVNVCTLGTSIQIIQENGVLYYLINAETLKPFAGREIYLAAFEGMMPFNKLVSTDNGGFEYADNYDGVRAIFTLPGTFAG